VTVSISNTLGGGREPFTPLNGNNVKMYVCGMTPKREPHIGHARLFVAMDMIRRYLAYCGYEVQHVQNITDVDDKIIAAAEREGVTADEVAQKYTDAYDAVMGNLNVLRAHDYPKVTKTLPQIIEMIEGLIENGSAYAAEEAVYFSVPGFADYGALSTRTEESGIQAGASGRVDDEPGKRDPRDFALWKPAKPGEPWWQSPWGKGRPGWHIECSTMIYATLGEQIDIHGGGADLIFPHHENEIAQSEAFTGKVPFTKYWLHTGLLTINGQKMAHSLGNFITIEDILKEYSGPVLRLYLLSVHYRSPLTYTPDNLEQARAGMARLTGALRVQADGDASKDGELAQATQRAEAGFYAAMESDFNSAGAMGQLYELVRDINRLGAQAQPATLQTAQEKLVLLADILGIDLQEVLEAELATGDGDAGAFIDLLVELRADLRKEKQFALADKVRDELTALGIALEDAPGGTVWRRKA
jgi:cysteinyl-tRNA synthetase